MKITVEQFISKVDPVLYNKCIEINESLTKAAAKACCDFVNSSGWLHVPEDEALENFTIACNKLISANPNI